MSDFLKGNYKVEKEITEKSDAKKEGSEALMEEVRRKALSSLGGSMVYMERNTLIWDGEETGEEKDPKSPPKDE